MCWGEGKAPVGLRDETLCVRVKARQQWDLEVKNLCVGVGANFCAHQWDLGVRHISIGKIVDIALRLGVPHQNDASWQDAVISGSRTSAHHSKLLEQLLQYKKEVGSVDKLFYLYSLLIQRRNMKELLFQPSGEMIMHRQMEGSKDSKDSKCCCLMKGV